MGALLELEEVRAGYGPTSVLHGISLEVQDGEVVSLLGANGAGKTTTLRAITAGVRWTGDIRFAGKSLRKMHTEDVVRHGIAHVPEGRGILTELTVEENLKLGSHLRRDGPAVRKDYDRVFEYFPVLRDRRRLSASTLSGGEQQMLALARAFLMKPRLMLLDEPSLGLAPLIVRQIFDAIKTLNAQDGLTVFLVEQNAFHALKLAHRGYVMVNGLITLSGSGRELLERPEIKAAYLEGGRQQVAP
jgi:branched-chain amino acid transport system ATP-binding protein